MLMLYYTIYNIRAKLKKFSRKNKKFSKKFFKTLSLCWSNSAPASQISDFIKRERLTRDGEMLTEVGTHKKDGLLSQAIRLPNNDSM